MEQSCNHLKPFEHRALLSFFYFQALGIFTCLSQACHIFFFSFFLCYANHICHHLTYCRCSRTVLHNLKYLGFLPHVFNVIQTALYEWIYRRMSAKFPWLVSHYLLFIFFLISIWVRYVKSSSHLHSPHILVGLNRNDNVALESVNKLWATVF